MKRVVSALLSTTILIIALSSCGTNSDAQDYVLNETEIFLANNFQLEDSKEFLRECLFPIAFREKW